MNLINVNHEGYSAPSGVKDAQNNWAAAYAKREVSEHKTAPVLDHPDGCVTENKLSDEVKAIISEAYETAQTASETASTAKATAETAKSVADIAKTTAEDAFNYSDEARGMANDADARSAIATATAEEAEQRAISAEAKADAAVVTAVEALRKSEDASNDVENHSKDAEVHITSVERRAWNLASIEADEAKIMTGENSLKLSLLEESIPSKVSQLENDADYVTEERLVGTATYLEGFIEGLLLDKADKTEISYNTVVGKRMSYHFAPKYNEDTRARQRDEIAFYFDDGEYEDDYISGLSFDSGETPTSIDYFHTGIIQWVGTDCTIDSYVNDEGVTIPVSIFQPSPNTHYEVVFYFNGTQFIGLVNGYKPVAENEPFYADEVV